MNGADIATVADEAAVALIGRQIGRVFQLGPNAFAVDFHPHAGVYLFFDVNNRVRQFYLIRRKLKELERSSTHPSGFALQFRNLLANKSLIAVATVQASQTVVFKLGEGMDLVLQLGGDVPNAFILGSDGIIAAAARESRTTGQRVDDHFVFTDQRYGDAGPTDVPDGRTLSDVLDETAQSETADSKFDAMCAEARRKLRSDIKKRQRLLANIEGDLDRLGDAEQWKRYGDLLLAGATSARKEDDAYIVTDLYDDDAGEIAIPAEGNATPALAAEDYFSRYAKARNAAAVASKRLRNVRNEIAALEAGLLDLELAIKSKNIEAISAFLPKRQVQPEPKKKAAAEKDKFKGARRFISSDGFEILVGKRAVDNDFLTFRIANSLDLWLHAADYPGSHVVVRNPGRKEVPDRTLVEAAELAAFYSDARGQGKAAVRYTQRKFVNKPKRSAPGLVSLASFRTLMAEPKVGVALA